VGVVKEATRAITGGRRSGEGGRTTDGGAGERLGHGWPTGDKRGGSRLPTTKEHEVKLKASQRRR
jgi:hypothetical protein